MAILRQCDEIFGFRALPFVYIDKNTQTEQLHKKPLCVEKYSKLQGLLTFLYNNGR